VDDPDDDQYARPPEIEDVARLGRALNEAGARYLLIGGFAVVAHGYERATKDIDLLADDSPRTWPA
jgi:predicted nucleotidyltransferase